MCETIHTDALHIVDVNVPIPLVYPSYACTRCSGDFSQLKQTKYLMSLPALPDAFIAANLPGDINDRERYIISQPGMFGRLWFGQALAFDEAYQILQESYRVNVYAFHDSDVMDCILHMHCVVCILALRICVYYIDIMFTFVQDFAILSDPKDATKSSGTSGQNPNAGWFNKFVQTGKSDHEPKSGESCGGQPFRMYCTI